MALTILRLGIMIVSSHGLIIPVFTACHQNIFYIYNIQRSSDDDSYGIIAADAAKLKLI